MPIFGPPNIKKLKQRQNVLGLIKALDYEKSDAVREQAVEALGELGAKGATEPLVRLLNEGKGRPDDALILEALEKIKDKSAVPALVERIRARGADVCSRELGALRSIGRGAAEPLLQVLREQSRNPRQALTLIRELEKIGGDAVASGLLPLVSPDLPSLIIDLAETLERLGERRAVEPLSDALNASPEEPWAARIAGVLKRLGWTPENEEQKAALYLAERNWEELEAVGTPAVSMLVSLVGRGTSPEAAKAIDVLSRTGDERAVEPALALLNHKNQDLAAKAAGALGKIGRSRNVVEALLQAAADSEAAPVKEAVEHALIEIGGHAVFPLLSHLNSGDPRERKAAVRILGEIGDSRALQPLIAEREDRSLQPELDEAITKLGGLPHDHDE